MHVDGEIHGDVHCISLTVGEKAVVTGGVVAERVVVHGHVKGPISARNITLKTGARVDSDICHHNLKVEKGATFKGSSRPAGSPLSIRQRNPSQTGERSEKLRRFSRALKLPTFNRPAFRHSFQGLVSRLRYRSENGPIAPPEFLLRHETPKRIRRWRFRIASPAFSLLTIVSAVGLMGWFYSLPPPAVSYPLRTTLEAPTERELILLAADGKEFARRGGCFDTGVAVSEVPKHFIAALLAMEDRRFYSHVGIDPLGVLRAALFNYNAGRIVQGGSTLTQQLAKISYLSDAKTFARKLEEAIIVLRLELSLTKNQILERYLARAYFGDGCYGLRAAARHYFDRNVSELSLAQSAYLVALLKSPTVLARDPEALRARERLVLQAMVEDGRLAKADIEKIKPAARKAKASLSGAYYADWIAETTSLPDDGDFSALPVRTTFEPALQHIAEQAVRKILKRSSRSRKAGQAALVAMRPDGRIVAMVGGVDHEQSQFNRATQALRQPGSSFKAFVYLAAMRAGGRPDMQVLDEPVAIGDWTPENYSRKYRGLVTLQNAFSSSINTVAVRLSEAVGRAEVVKAARDLGITTPLISDPSIALGTSEVTLLELTAAYAAFAANAYPVKPWGIASTGGSISRSGRPPKDAGLWRMVDGDRMRALLAATVQRGTGRGARLAIPAFGKTGTSQNYRDAWFIGFAGNLIVGVWVGNDDNTPMRHVTGGNLPTLIWRDFMSRAQRRDRHFRPKLPGRVAAFRAKTPSRRGGAIQATALDLLLLRGDQQLAGDINSDAGFGSVMLFGDRTERARRRPVFRERPARARPAYSWSSEDDGS